MKKILSILICLVLGVSSVWAANWYVTVKAFTENKDNPSELGGTVTLKVTQSKSDKNGTATTSANGVEISKQAKGQSGGFLGIGDSGAEIVLSMTVNSGYYVDGVYRKEGDGAFQLVGTSTNSITINETVDKTYTYKVVYAYRGDIPESITSTTENVFYTGTEIFVEGY